MTDITIPPGALTASKEEVATMLYAHPYKSLSGGKKDVCDNIAYAACLAMIKNWPGMTYAKWRDYGQADRLVLPIPPEALRAARAAFMNARGDGDDQIRAACLAMLRSWPGLETEPCMIGQHVRMSLILPLPQENTNERE